MRVGLMQGRVSAEAFMLVGEDIISKKKRNTKSDMIRRRRFQSNFGTAPEICSNIWARIMFTRRKQIPFSNPAPKHLLWALHLMKTYGTEDCLASNCGVDEKTFRRWAWIFIEEIARLSRVEVSDQKSSNSLQLSDQKLSIVFFRLQIDWENRKKFDNGSLAKITVDGTDFRIPLYGGAANFKKYKSHKFNGPGLRYEVAIAIQTGDIVHVNGPFACGKHQDIAIFRKKLKKKMRLGYELAEADKGYRGEPLLIELPDMDGGAGAAQISAKNKARGRHETCNKRFKQWNCLSNRFRHSEKCHGLVFHAIVALTQIDIRSGNPLYQVDYKTILTPLRKKNLRSIRKLLRQQQGEGNGRV